MSILRVRRHPVNRNRSCTAFSAFQSISRVSLFRILRCFTRAPQAALSVAAAPRGSDERLRHNPQAQPHAPCGCIVPAASRRPLQVTAADGSVCLQLHPQLAAARGICCRRRGAPTGGLQDFLS